MKRTIADAKRLLQRKLSNYQEAREFQTAFLGDGRGFAASNMYVPGAPDYVWARTSLDTGASQRHFPVLNRSAVNPAFGMPVYVGYKDEEVNQFQVISVNYAAIGSSGFLGASITGVGAHHTQHEWGGGDEVFSDGLQFKPGLVAPTGPASMSVQVLAFTYYWNAWKRFSAATTPSLAQYRPDAGFMIYLLIALDPYTDSLVYRPGNAFNAAAQASLGTTEFNFDHVPAPAGDELPLGFVSLVNGQTSIDWRSLQNNIADARLHFAFPMRSILDRLAALEGNSGNMPNLPCTGAA